MSCAWKMIDEDHNAYECSGCGKAWCILDGTPEENDYNYCPNCGRRIGGVIE